MSQIPSQMRNGKGGVRDLSTRKWNSEFHLCAGFLLTSKVYSYLRPARHNAFGLCGGRYRLAIALCQLRMMTAITSKSWCQSRLVKPPAEPHTRELLRTGVPTEDSLGVLDGPKDTTFGGSRLGPPPRALPSSVPVQSRPD